MFTIEDFKKMREAVRQARQERRLSNPNRARLDENGHEKLSEEPFEIPVKFRETPEQKRDREIRQMIRNEFSRAMVDSGHESFDEADDFDVFDDPIDPESPYEINFDPDIQGTSKYVVDQHGVVHSIPNKTPAATPPSDVAGVVAGEVPKAPVAPQNANSTDGNKT